MKTKISIIIINVFASLLFACNKEDDDNTNASVKQQISLVADGVPFSVTTGGSDVLKADAHIRDGNKFQLNGTTSTKDISISNNAVPATGNYILTGAGTVANFFQWEDGDDLFGSIGTTKSRLILNITRVAGNSSDYVRYVEGTFSGVFYNLGQTDSVIITNGQISIIE